MKFEEALRRGEGYTLMEVNVSTGAKRTGIVRFNEWRKAIDLNVKSPAKDGKANRDIIREMEKLFKVKVEIIRGTKSNIKTLRIHEEYESVVEVLRDILESDELK